MKWLRRVLAGLLVLAILVGGGGYLWLSGSLPKLDGTVTVAGVEQPVEIIRDRFGVPHIYAQSLADASFALGYAHAQDRLWQMEMSRRIGAGRLSELFGAQSLNIDKFLRTLGVYRAAARDAAALDGDTRAALAAYAAGVNAFLDGRDGALPPEFLILGVSPEPWTPADSLVWAKMMAFDTSTNWRNELLRARMATRLSPRQIAEAFPPYPADAPVTLAGLLPLYEALPLDRLFAAVEMPSPLRNGSNNWVVDGRRTASGRPLLANDPHLGLTAPSVWYFAHLEIAGQGVIGATLPGLPVVVIGRNDRIAWGFTTTGSDVQDLYIEKLDPADPGRYLTPDGWAPFATRTELIGVKDGAPLELRVRSTRHGPVISDILTRGAGLLPEGQVLAMAWTALAAGDRTARAFFAFAEAQGWDEFVAAARDFHESQQNIVYADVDGIIGFVAPARVPLRKPENEVRGLAPVPGWDARYDWDGWIPFAALPQAKNPAAGMVVTANNRIVGDDYPYHLTDEWDAPYRARRIEGLLQAGSGHTVAGFKAMQNDVGSAMAEAFLPLLLAAEPAGDTARAVLDLLRRWDGRMAGGRIEPTVFTAWMRELTRLTFADEMGDLFADFWGHRSVFMANILADRDGQGRWCDDIRTAPVESCADLLPRALDLALADLTARFGADRDDWRWSAVHRAKHAHRPFSDVALLRPLFEITRPFAGDNFTINRAATRIGDDADPFSAIHGPTLRAVFDLARPDASVFIHPTGQSGNPLSPLYDSFADMWAAGDYIPMTMRRQDFEPQALGRLILKPAS